MKTKKILEEMAELIAKRGMHKVEPILIEALKKHYGVSGLYFWKDASGWTYCTENDPITPGSGGLWGREDVKHMDLDELSRCLKGIHAGHTYIMFEGNRCTDLDEIRRFVLTKKLAGIK